ncbi:SseB family protein [Intrasporangium sp. DVR]|uniref:SseB family protein n=1 Tax=Intrasporangium sp. DVR TaxID=3127867 RepID=UPI00313A6339
MTLPHDGTAGLQRARQHGHVDDEGRPSDSVGQAWAGKTIPVQGFADDRGDADPGVITALRSCAGHPTPDAEVELMARVAVARWLVPVVAVPTEVDETGGLVTDTRSEMAAVVLTAPDGRRALPMFTSLESLAAWDPEARPVPVPASSAAQSAITESCDALLVDVSSPHAVVLRASMLWALAQDRPWLPAHLDDHVARAIRAAVADEPFVAAHRVEAGEPLGAGVLRVVLELPSGLDEPAVSALATRVGERIATDGEARARIDALTFALEAAT